jgi:hypothetical protein
MHNVFHVALLKPYRVDGTVQPPIIPSVLDNEVCYEVGRVLQHKERRVDKRVVYDYLIEWADCGPEHNSSKPKKSLHADLVKRYWDDRNKRVNSKVVV